MIIKNLFPQVMILYFQPNTLHCILLRWVRLMGFATVYGTVILKLFRWVTFKPLPVSAAACLGLSGRGLRSFMTLSHDLSFFLVASNSPKSQNLVV